MTETEREMVERHVRDGEHHVATQREILEHLRMHGRDTALAERTLANLEAMLALHHGHLARLKSGG